VAGSAEPHNPYIIERRHQRFMDRQMFENVFAGATYETRQDVLAQLTKLLFRSKGTLAPIIASPPSRSAEIITSSEFRIAGGQGI
jgi:hypothetical protein